MFYLHSHTGPHTFIIIEVLCGLQGLGGMEEKGKTGEKSRKRAGERENAATLTAAATSTATGAICFHFVLTSAGRARWNKRLSLKPKLKPELETGVVAIVVVVVQAKFGDAQQKVGSGSASGAALTFPVRRAFRARQAELS